MSGAKLAPRMQHTRVDPRFPCARPSPPQLSISVLHLSRNVASGYLSIACALQCILLLFK